MKIKITEAWKYEHEDYLLINQEGSVVSVSGNTEFNDLGISIPNGNYLVVQVLKEQAGLGCTLEIVGCQYHMNTGVQEYSLLP